MRNEHGALNILLIPFILAVIFFLGAAGFGAWAYMERQDYKDNSDKKVDAAVAVAVEKAKSDKDNEFTEKEKEPLRQYKGPDALGSITFQYPKTWSVYEDTSGGRLKVLAYPKVVPADQSSTYALKVEVIEQSYDSVAKSYENKVKSGELKAKAYALPKLPKNVGLRLDGVVDQNKRGAVIILPLRDKTLKITTESEQFVKDFDKNILPNFKFRP